MPKKDIEVEFLEIEPEIEQRVDELRVIESTVNNIVVNQFTATKLLGQIESFTVLENYSKTARTVLLMQIREAKAYKGLKMPTEHGIKEINTFEEYCELVGVSYSKAKEDIQNLKLFGQEFMESSERMGLGYRDLRKLRTLPEAEREEILGKNASTEDPEILKDLLEELCLKSSKAKAEVKDLKGSLEAKEKIIAQKNKELDKTKEELIRFKDIPLNEVFKVQAEKETEALRKIHLEGMKILGQVNGFLAQCLGVLESECSQSTRDMVNELVSGLYSNIAMNTLNNGIDVDFRIITYPLDLGEIAERNV